MTRRVLLVPLIAGAAVSLLGLVGLPLGCVAGLVALLALGAVYRDEAFAAGVTFGVPGVAVMLVRALTESVWLVVASLIVAPVGLYLGGVIARVGNALVSVAEPVAVPVGAKPGSIADVHAQEAVGRRRRGLILVVVFASFLVGSYALNALFNDAADRRAEEARIEMLRATADWTTDDVVRWINGNGGGGTPYVGWPVTPRLDPAAVEASVYYGWAQRCVIVEVEGARRSWIRRGDCTGRVSSRS